MDWSFNSLSTIFRLKLTIVFWNRHLSLKLVEKRLILSISSIFPHFRHSRHLETPVRQRKNCECVKDIYVDEIIVFCLNFEKYCSIFVLGQFLSDFDDFYIKTFRSSSLINRVLSFKSLSGHFQDENAADSFVRTFDWKFCVTKVVLKAQSCYHHVLPEKSFLKHGLPSL